MGWLGKFFGAGIGFALRGPLGAPAGVTLGHGVDHFLFLCLASQCLPAPVGHR